MSLSMLTDPSWGYDPAFESFGDFFSGMPGGFYTLGVNNRLVDRDTGRSRAIPIDLIEARLLPPPQGTARS